MSSGSGRRARRRFTPGPTTLLAFYPAAWRRRYGDELDALILDMHADGRETGARLRLDLLRAAAAERLRGGGDPSRRVRGGASLVLWAWAVFVIAGAMLAKTSEHWQQALPGAAGAQVAFTVLKVVAFAASAAVAAGIAVTLPAARRLLRERGWARIRARALAAIGLSAAVVVATAGLTVWAHGLTAADRNGHDHVYGLAFAGWAVLVTACLFAWTSVAARIVGDVRCGRATLRAQARLAPAVAVAMAAMTAATLVWWAVVAAHSPGALVGGSSASHPAALVPVLVLAAALMVLATAVATVGALRAERGAVGRAGGPGLWAGLWAGAVGRGCGPGLWAGAVGRGCGLGLWAGAYPDVSDFWLGAAQKSDRRPPWPAGRSARSGGERPRLLVGDMAELSTAGRAPDNQEVPEEVWRWDETLYAGSATHYVTGRMPYPADLGARIVAAAAVGGEARALDVGCGPGSLTLRLAGSVREVVGVDADAEMLVQAQLAAERSGVGNARWRRMRAEALPGDLGSFDLVTFAQSFHWMERQRVAATVRGMLREGGACVHVGATTNRGDGSEDPLPRPRPPYAQIIALVDSFLGPVPRAGRSARPAMVAGSEIGIYRTAGFAGPLRVEVKRGEVVERSVAEIVAATFSLSSSTPALFGADRERFEGELRALLEASALDGRFCERMRDITFDVWRPR